MVVKLDRDRYGFFFLPFTILHSFRTKFTQTFSMIVGVRKVIEHYRRKCVEN